MSDSPVAWLSLRSVIDQTARIPLNQPSSRCCCVYRDLGKALVHANRISDSTPRVPLRVLSHET